MNSFAKTLAFCLISSLPLFFYTNQVNAQGAFDLNDPNILFADKDGRPMTMDSVKSFVSKGTFSMLKQKLENGKIEIRLMRDPHEAGEDLVTKFKKELIDKWVGKPFPDFELMSLTGRNIKGS